MNSQKISSTGRVPGAQIVPHVRYTQAFQSALQAMRDAESFSKLFAAIVLVLRAPQVERLDEPDRKEDGSVEHTYTVDEGSVLESFNYVPNYTPSGFLIDGLGNRQLFTDLWKYVNSFERELNVVVADGQALIIEIADIKLGAEIHTSIYSQGIKFRLADIPVIEFGSEEGTDY